MRTAGRRLSVSVIFTGNIRVKFTGKSSFPFCDSLGRFIKIFKKMFCNLHAAKLQGSVYYSRFELLCCIIWRLCKSHSSRTYCVFSSVYPSQQLYVRLRRTYGTRVQGYKKRKKEVKKRKIWHKNFF